MTVTIHASTSTEDSKTSKNIWARTILLTPECESGETSFHNATFFSGIFHNRNLLSKDPLRK